MALELPDPVVVGPAYAGIRARVTELLTRPGGGGVDAGVAGTVVPLTPEWTVHDLVAHLCGTIEDVLAGNIEQAGSEAWTAAQVERHRDESVDEILTTWNELAPQLEAMVSAFPAAPAAQMVFDAATHEHDLRHALGRPGGRDSDAVEVGLTYMVHMLGRGISGGHLPPLRLELGDDHIELEGPAGTGDSDLSPVTLRTTKFEFLRSFGGRRSVEQIRSLDWQGDPGPYIASISRSPVSPSDHDVDE